MHFCTGLHSDGGAPVGGLNPYAVEHGFKLNARLVWMPTFSAANHIRHSHRKNYLATKDAMLKPKALTVVNDAGELLDEPPR